MISIIVPVYNAEDYLNECLLSISRQSYTDFEAILINDGSTDKSLSICHEWEKKDRRFKVISVSNGGVSYARNIGLEKAQGRYVCFIDSDDYIHEKYLEDFSEHFSNYDIIVSDYSRKENLGTKGINEFKSTQNYIQDIVYERIKHPNIVDFCVNKGLINNNFIRFTQGCIIGEDYEFYMKCLASCKTEVAITNFVSYYYRDNPSSAMNKRLTKRSFTTIEASRKVDQILAEKGIISGCDIATSNEILTLAFYISHQRNKDLYEQLHKDYPVKKAMKTMLHFPVLKKRFVAIVYLTFGEKLFYHLIP